MANTNRYPGLARGPIDHKSSSVINQISDGAISMGSCVTLVSNIITSELLPRVRDGNNIGDFLVYGIAVGGDIDGIYGDGSNPADDAIRATNGAGQGIVIVTQGRCLARVEGLVVVGDQLGNGNSFGKLQKATSGDTVIAIALHDVAAGDVDMIPVDVQRTGVVS